MKPKEIFKILEKKKFSMFRRADIILVNSHKGFFSKLIRIKEKSAVVTHSEIYGFTGHAIGANNDGINIKNISRFFKGNYDVYVYRCNKLSTSAASDVFYRACRWLGRPYDWWGIACQFMDWCTRSTWFSRKLNGKKLPYCSELLQRAYGYIRIAKKPIGVATPFNIYSYLKLSKNWSRVFYMKKTAKGWDSNALQPPTEGKRDSKQSTQKTQ